MSEKQVKAPKTTFKRQDVYALGKLIEARCSPPGPTRVYLADQSDATVATVASEQLGRPVTPADVTRVRHQIIGKLAGEGRPKAEEIQNLVRSLSAQAVTLRKLEDRVVALERELMREEPPHREQTRHGNGYQHPRPNAR